jgi:dipeptidyl aminopeptidase/acylaminoacyl peptidase
MSYIKADERSDIWRVGGPAAPEEDRTPTRFISSTRVEQFPEYSPDGQKILFASGRSGPNEIWICDSDGSNPRRLTFLEDESTLGSWSPDGKQIAFMSLKEGSLDIYVVKVAGGFPRRLTKETSDEFCPRWSRDGRWIYFCSNRTGGNLELFKVPAEGGDAVQLTKNGGTVASESPDGRFIYFSKTTLEWPPRPLGIWRIPVDGGEEVQVHDREVFLLWEVLEQGIFYWSRDSIPPALELLDLTTGEVKQVAVLEKKPDLYGFSVSPDGRWLLYRVFEAEEDIMLVENFY